MSLTAPPTIVLLLAGDTSHPDPDLDQNSTESVISLSLSWREEEMVSYYQDLVYFCLAAAGHVIMTELRE